MCSLKRSFLFEAFWFRDKNRHMGFFYVTLRTQNTFESALPFRAEVQNHSPEWPITAAMKMGVPPSFHSVAPVSTTEDIITLKLLLPVEDSFHARQGLFVAHFGPIFPDLTG